LINFPMGNRPEFRSPNQDEETEREIFGSVAGRQKRKKYALNPEFFKGAEEKILERTMFSVKKKNCLS